MTDFDIDKIEKEMAERDARFAKTEEEGLKNILKYFDRIHDKLFSVNTVYIAGFIALIKISDKVYPLFILVPILNMLYLIWIEYRMLQKSRFESMVTQKTQNEINQWGKDIQKTNLLSLISIILTLIVAIIFVYLLFI